MPKTYILDVEEMELRRLMATDHFRDLMSQVPIKEPGPNGVVRRGRSPDDGQLHRIAVELTAIMNISHPVVRITANEPRKQTDARRTLLAPSGVSPRRRLAESEQRFLYRRDYRTKVCLLIVSPE